VLTDSFSFPFHYVHRVCICCVRIWQLLSFNIEHRPYSKTIFKILRYWTQRGCWHSSSEQIL